MGDILLALMLAAAISAISMTVTTGSIFRGLRRWADAKGGTESNPKSRFWKFVGDLVHCPYCFSHWMAFVMVAIYQPRPIRASADMVLSFSVPPVIDLAVAAFMIVAVAALLCGLIKASLDVIHGKD